jgi:hypothetical protein
MRKKLLVFYLLLIGGLLVVSTAWAMSSGSYRLDWLVPVSGGGGTASSETFRANLTIGQSFIGASVSPAFESVLGFWGMEAQHWPIYLPAVSKLPE